MSVIPQHQEDYCDANTSSQQYMPLSLQDMLEVNYKLLFIIFKYLVMFKLNIEINKIATI